MGKQQATKPNPFNLDEMSILVGDKMNIRKTALILIFVCISTFLVMKTYDLKNRINLRNATATKVPDLFVDEHFKIILSNYKEKRHRGNKIQAFRSGKLPTFFLATEQDINSPFWKHQLEDIILGQCPSQCSFTDNISRISEVDGVVFYLREMKDARSMNKYVANRNPKQPWIMLSFEAALLANSNHKTPFKEFNGIFNRTMMHRTDADIFTPHGFVVSNNDAELLPSSWTRPYLEDSIYKFTSPEARLLAVSFISNCNAKSGRGDYIKKMKLYSSEIDIYGSCGTKKCGGRHYVQHGYKTESDPCFVMAAEKYMFYLSFENSICKDYITEKLYNFLYHPLVPIVLGGADYGKILPPNSYINAANYSPKELVRLMVYLRNHPQEYLEYFSWKKWYKVSTIGGQRLMCHLCVRLNDPTFYHYNVYEDFDNWFNKTSNCKRTWKA